MEVHGISYKIGALVRLLSKEFYDNRETPLAGNFVGQCQGHKSDVSTQSWVLISEKDNVTISGGCLYTHEWRELVTGGEVRNGMEKIMAIII